jgi:hypothetical protein
MVIDNTPDEHPVDRLARIERLAREGINAACESLNLSPNERLMGAEAMTRAAYEECMAHWTHADRLPEYETQANLDADGITIIVTYHPLRSWRYEFTRSEGGLRGAFDSRYSCLLALAARRTVRQ